MKPVKLDRIEFASVRATERSEWVFAEITDCDGATAIAEITSGDSAKVVTKIVELFSALKGREIADESQVEAALGLDSAALRADRAAATAVSALRTAILDLQALRANLSMTEALGGTPTESVQLYANINRALFATERKPRDFARVAERAVKDGFTIVKCAPFDEVRPPSSPDRILEAARPGLERVAAVRLAVGPRVTVLVDCHSRFERHTAHIVAGELAKLNIGWFEEPLQPTDDPDGLAELANELGIPLAGGESGYGVEFFADLVRRKAVRTIMPDVKHCGGAAEALRAGKAAIELGGQFSMHSPSGPISQLASAHTTAAVPGAFALEHAVYEAEWRAALVTPRERIEKGRFLLPVGPGLGARLNEDLVSRYGRRWKP